MSLKSAEVTSSAQLARLEQSLQTLYHCLTTHPLYQEMESLGDLHRFMESHVYAVWDFMSLLKSLQRNLTCISVPWVPTSMPESRRLVNEIVLGEESDMYQGRAASHFEIYCTAMEQAGADTRGIHALLSGLAAGASLQACLAACPHPAAAAFVADTFATLAQEKPHVTAAAFTFGREDLIPNLFEGFVRSLDPREDGRVALFLWYLRRHIKLDGEEHGPMARRMVAELCGNDPMKWAEAERAALSALQSRLRLWDGVLATMREHRLQPA